MCRPVIEYSELKLQSRRRSYISAPKLAFPASAVQITHHSGVSDSMSVHAFLGPSLDRDLLHSLPVGQSRWEALTNAALSSALIP